MTEEKKVITCNHCGHIYDEDKGQGLNWKVILWIYRIVGILFINLFGYFDRALTSVAVESWGIAVENNPIMRFLAVNPWYGVVAGAIASIAFIYAFTSKTDRTVLVADICLMLILTIQIIIMANHVIQFTSAAPNVWKAFADSMV